MSPAPGTIAIAVHVEAAKRLLRELERHAETTIEALGRDSGDDDLLSAIEERDGILARLDDVVEALSQERSPSGEKAGATDPEAVVLFAEMARAAAAALQSHGHLASQTRHERDRLVAALQRTSTPDVVAHHYGVSSSTSPQPRNLSVTG